MSPPMTWANGRDFGYCPDMIGPVFRVDRTACCSPAGSLEQMRHGSADVCAALGVMRLADLKRLISGQHERQDAGECD
jgi:hypothetical protein